MPKKKIETKEEQRKKFIAEWIDELNTKKQHIKDDAEMAAEEIDDQIERLEDLQ